MVEQNTWGLHVVLHRLLKGVGQTEGTVTPHCAASATWNPHVDVKGLEDAAGMGLGFEEEARTVQVKALGGREKAW